MIFKSIDTYRNKDTIKCSPLTCVRQNAVISFRVAQEEDGQRSQTCSLYIQSRRVLITRDNMLCALVFCWRKQVKISLKWRLNLGQTGNPTFSLEWTRPVRQYRLWCTLVSLGKERGRRNYSFFNGNYSVFTSHQVIARHFKLPSWLNRLGTVIIIFFLHYNIIY